jgi:hypothetical protein
MAALVESGLKNLDYGDADDPQQWGEWIAEVQRPPEQFRGRYQLRLDDARQLIELACSN